MSHESAGRPSTGRDARVGPPALHGFALMAVVVLLIGLSPPVAVFAAPWEAYEAADGTEIQVDSASGRAYRVERGERRLLWDGVHRLANGRVLIIRHGTVQRTRALGAGEEFACPGLDQAGPQPCARLVNRVCGPGGSCADREACGIARQLRAARGTEEAEGSEEYVLCRCARALTNPNYFMACPSGTGTLNACRRLVTKVCGSNEACADAPACAPARELLGQVQEGQGPEAIEQCRQALAAPSFFRDCASD